MPDLSQIVGGLLRDIAKARFGSDLYARDVARYYEQEGLLRRFPVPRPEVTEVEIDLKFLVGTIDLEPTQHELTEATLATVYEPFADRITTVVRERLLAQSDLAGPVAERAASNSVRIDLRKAVLKTLLDSWGRVAEPPRSGEARETAARELAAKVRKALQTVLAHDLEPGEEERKEAPPSGSRKGPPELVRAALEDASRDVQAQLVRLADELARAAESRGDCRVEIEVGHDRVSQAPQGAISTIRVKAAVRNYVWTQVESEKGDGAWFALNRE